MADIKQNSEKLGFGGTPLQSRSSSSQAEVEHEDAPRVNVRGGVSDTAKARLEASRKLANPLSGYSHEQLSEMGEKYARSVGLDSEEDIRAFRLGAVAAGDENKYDTIDGLTQAEIETFDREVTHKWSNPKALYWYETLLPTSLAEHELTNPSQT
jgi:hypothetical protein